VTFQIGQRVVCVDDLFSDRPEWRRAVQTFPKLYSVYTIRKIVERGELTGFCFDEIFNRPAMFDDALLEPAFNSENFRPVETSNIEAFKRMLALADPP
jgi:hypothetical protein